KVIGDNSAQLFWVGKLERKTTDAGDAGNGFIERIDDFGHAPDIGFGGGDNKGVSTFIGAHLRVSAQQRLQIGRQLADVGVAHRDNLSDHLVAGGNGVDIGPLLDRNVPFLGLIKAYNSQGAAIADGGV